MSNGRFSAFWMVTFLGFPLGGLLAVETVGSIDDVRSGLLAGALAGLVIGTAQFLALRRRVRVGPEWVLTTALGLAVGNAAGTALTDSGTGIADLLVTGVAAGVAVGIAQWLILRRHEPLALLWPLVVAVAWPVGWTATWAIAVDVERGYAMFGASGALVFAAITGAAMVLVTRRSPSATPAPVPTGLIRP